MFNLYHIITATGNVIEVAAKSQREALRLALYPDYTEIRVQPITGETLLDADDLDFNHDLGTVTYAVAHWADAEGEFWTVQVTDLDEEIELVDDDSYTAISNKLKSLDGSDSYNSIDDAKRAIKEVLNETEEIFENATHIQWPDEDAAYDEWRCNH